MMYGPDRIPSRGGTVSNWDTDQVPTSSDTAILGDDALDTSAITIELRIDQSVGVLTFDRTVSYTIDSTVGANTLSLTTGNLNVSSGSHTINSNLDVPSTGIWDIASGASLNLEGELLGDGRITLVGGGGVIIPSMNSYTGRVTLNYGVVTLRGESSLVNATLEVGDGELAFAAGVSQFELWQLMGDGSLDLGGRSLTISGGGGLVHPASGSIGRLAVKGDLNLEGAYRCDIDGAASDGLFIEGELDISSATLDLRFANVTSPPTSGYIIATYDSLQGEFASVTGALASSFTVEYAWNGNSIALVPVGYVPQILHVDQKVVGGAQDGSSWANAFPHLQDALDATATGLGQDQIWVAEGTYYPDERSGANTDDRSATFYLPNGV